MKNSNKKSEKPSQLSQSSQPQLLPNIPINVKPIFNITKQNNSNTYNNYRCIDPSLEVNVQDEENIFFGYDENLFIKAQDNSNRLYYKYSYRDQKFFKLIKKEDGTFEEKEIDIDFIPTYDILRLYGAIKDNPNKNKLKNKLLSRIYRCIDPSLEVNVQDEENIFFGYDENLFIKAQNNSYRLYYKYSYRDQKFFELTKKEDGTFEEKEIDIDFIPTYDILRLYNAIKDNLNKNELRSKLNTRIETAKKNISETGEAFLKLDHSNFDKEKKEQQISETNLSKTVGKENLEKIGARKKITSSTYKNFGKVKKRRITGTTYIFFGATNSKNSNRNSPGWFSYVCFNEGNKVYFYQKSEQNKKIPLYEFPYIYPLEDLISFILLRRLIINNDTFEDIIYKEADARIKFLKVNNFSKKMLKQEFPKNYVDVGFNNIRYSNNYKKSTSILPISPEKISNILL